MSAVDDTQKLAVKRLARLTATRSNALGAGEDRVDPGVADSEEKRITELLESDDSGKNAEKSKGEGIGVLEIIVILMVLAILAYPVYGIVIAFMS